MTKRSEDGPGADAARGAPSRIPAGSLLPLWRRIHQEFVAHSRRWGLPANVWMSLLHLHFHPEEAEPAAMAAATGLPRQTVTFVLDVMEKKKLAVRGPHPNDRRRKVVRLTAAGRRSAEAMFRELVRFEAAALRAVGGQKLQRLTSFLTRYADALAAQNARGPT